MVKQVSKPARRPKRSAPLGARTPAPRRLRRAAPRRSPRTSAPRAVPRDGQTEQKILDAAHAVFVRSGTAGARTQEIAREAGVNSALLHYYFRTKDRLAQAVFQRAAMQLVPAVIFAPPSRAGRAKKGRQAHGAEHTAAVEDPHP